MTGLVAFFVGAIFAIGLGFSGMTQPVVVKGFLDIFGDWNPALMGVMGGAVVVHAIVYRLFKHRTSPLLDTQFHLPTRKDVDKKLVIGAALFGLGWGWAGICPGPGIVALLSGNVQIFIFVGSMLAGMGLFKLVEKKI